MDRETSQSKLESDPRLRVAAEWFLELRSRNVSGERIAEWQQWLSEDTAHLQAFEQIESFWQKSKDAVTRWPTDAEVAADNYTGNECISTWRGLHRDLSQRSRARHLFRRLSFAMPRFAAGAWALSAFAVLGCLLFLNWPRLYVMIQGGSRLVVDTDIGETRTLTLPDGSVVSVSGRTSLIVTLLKHSRDVALEHGEAFFRVSKDPARPFTVSAGGTTVTAVGTAFDVRRITDRVVIAVAEGVVRIGAAERSAKPPSARHADLGFTTDTDQLNAGQQLSVGPTGTGQQVSAVDINYVAGWREGRLQYLNEPLEFVVADLGRYSSRRILIDDPAVAQLRVTGVVFHQNIDAWLTSLETSLPIHVVRNADGSVLLSR